MNIDMAVAQWLIRMDTDHSLTATIFSTFNLLRYATLNFLISFVRGLMMWTAQAIHGSKE